MSLSADLAGTSMTDGLSMTHMAAEALQKDPKYPVPNPGEKTVTVPPHPLGVKPAGNAYTSKENLRSSLGSFRALTDELIIQVLEFLEASSLLRVGATCKALFAFASLEELWKALFIE